MIKKKENKLFVNIIVLLVSIVVILLILEIIARIFYGFYVNYNTEMWRYATELKKVSNNPNLQHEHKPNSEAHLYGADISINSDGIRDKEYPLEAGEETFRIVMLGDSITFGWGVQLNETFSERLESYLNARKPSKKFSKYEVINLGVGNYNTVMELESLKVKGLKYNPDLVILNYYINDAELLSKEVRVNPIKYTYLYGLLWDKFQNLMVLYVQGKDYRTYYSSLYIDGSEGKEQARNALREIIKTTKENKIKLLVVIYPEFHNFKNYEFDYVTKFVAGEVSVQNVSLLDLLPYYSKYDPEDIWVSYEDAHPNSLGHKIAADAVYAELSSKGFI